MNFSFQFVNEVLNKSYKIYKQGIKLTFIS